MSEPVPPLFYADHSDRGRLLLTGRDRQSFLQGMVTNDVLSLTPGQGCYAFLLDATGHVLADARILCFEDSLLLDVEPGMASFVAETLDKYLIMERVKIRDISAETGQILIGGPNATALLWHYGNIGARLASGYPANVEWGEGQNGKFKAVPEGYEYAASRWLPAATFDVFLPNRDEARDTLMQILQEYEAPELSQESFEALRIEAGVPRFRVDMDSRVLAPETGQTKRAIHYRKGCYIGQEIVARIDARGRVNRELTGFLLGGSELPAAETTVLADGKEVGRITSAAHSPHLGRPIALGYVRREHGEPGTVVTVAGAEATVAALPFVPSPVGAS